MSRVVTTRVLRRRRRVFSDDARWADGTVERDVDLVALMYRRAPADYEVTETAMHEHCPEEGVGAWIAYGTGQVVEEDA